MAKKDLSALAEDELVALSVAADEEIAASRERKAAIAAEVDRRWAEGQIERLGGPDGLAQLVKAAGIETNAVVGEP